MILTLGGKVLSTSFQFNTVVNSTTHKHTLTERYMASHNFTWNNKIPDESITMYTILFKVKLALYLSDITVYLVV